MLAMNLMGAHMGNQAAAANVQKFRQQYRDQHGGMTAAQVVGQRGQS